MHVLYVQLQDGTWGPWCQTCTALCCTVECICIPLIKQRYGTLLLCIVLYCNVMYCFVLYCTVARKERNKKEGIGIMKCEILVPCNQISWLLVLSCLVLSCLVLYVLWCDMVTCRVTYASVAATVQPAIHPSILFCTSECFSVPLFPPTSSCS